MKHEVFYFNNAYNHNKEIPNVDNGVMYRGGGGGGG